MEKNSFYYGMHRDVDLNSASTHKTKFDFRRQTGLSSVHTCGSKSGRRLINAVNVQRLIFGHIFKSNIELKTHFIFLLVKWLFSINKM